MALLIAVPMIVSPSTNMFKGYAILRGGQRKYLGYFGWCE
jgi:hypothetical protein